MLWNIQKSVLLFITFTIEIFVLVSVNHAEQDDYVFKSWATTRIKVERLKFTWTIENFSLHNLEIGASLSSPEFSGEGNKSYQLHVFPNGVNAHHKEYVSLILTTLTVPANVEYKIGLLNAEFKEINIVSGVHNFRWGRSESLVPVSLVDFINRHFLLNKNNGVLSNNKLIIFCEVNTVGIENTSGAFKQPQLSGLSSYFGKNLAYLFENRNFTDVIITVGEKEFYALKPILAARSPIFKTMFEHDMQEAKITRVEITDLEPSVVKEMLRYIYTEEVFDLKHLAPNLLAASVKYELEGLKVLCVDAMVENLTVENAAEFYVLSDTYSVVDLKMQVKDFVVAQASKVVHTLGFKSMIQTHPHLVKEVFGALGDLLSISCINKN